MPAPVTVYTTRTCPYCFAAKRLLSQRAIAYREIDVTGDAAKLAWLERVTGRHTVPQILIGEEPIGGYDDLAELDASGDLRVKVG
jgi:glutaredoxin 3